MNEHIKMLVEAAHRGTEMIGEDLKPDGDWSPMVFTVSNDQKKISIIGLPLKLFADTETKDALAYRILPYLVMHTNADAIALLTSTNMKNLIDGSHHEGLYLLAGTRDELYGQAAWIVRGEGPPTLDWQTPDTDGLDGRFPDGIRNAFDVDPSVLEGVKVDLEEL